MSEGAPSGGKTVIDQYVEKIWSKQITLEDAAKDFKEGSIFMDAIKAGLQERKDKERIVSSSKEEVVSHENKELSQEFYVVRDSETLRDAAKVFIPVQYHNLIEYPEILEEIWIQQQYIDADKNAKEKAVRDYAFSLIHLLRGDVEKDIQRDSEKERIKKLSEEIFISQATKETHLENGVSSLDFENDIFHHIENIGEGVDAVFWNNDKHQDAFAVKEKTVVVSDGAGSYERSGVVAGLLSKELAGQASGTGSFEEFTAVFQKDNIKILLTAIHSDDAYHSFVSEREFKNRDEGLCTFIVAKESADGRSIEYASLGDSPLIVVDRDSKGEVVAFEVINDSFNGQSITQDNFYKAETVAYINNPETHLVGIRKDGTIDTKSLSTVQIGRIEKKEGRTVVLASDALVKVMINAPRAFEAIGDSKDRNVIKEAFYNKAKNEKDGYSGLWDASGGFDFNTFSRPKSELADDLVKWKSNNYMFSDDLTVIQINAS